MVKPVAWICGLLLLAGCQTAQQKREDLLADRVRKLKSLSQFKPTQCRIEAELSAPAQARYDEMFPPAAAKPAAKSAAARKSAAKSPAPARGPLEFTWRARESVCEIIPAERTPLTANYKGFLEPSLCLLMQVYWVNSPFDEVPYATERLTERDGRIHYRTGDDKDFGLFLDDKDFVIETHTKGRGVLTAAYAEQDGAWLPVRLVQQTKNTVIQLDQFEWDTVPSQGRRMPRSLWISAGEDRPLAHSQLRFQDCREW